MLSVLLPIAVLAPLVGMFRRFNKTIGLVSLFFIFKWMFLGSFPVTFGVPTACAAVYWSLYIHQSGSELKKFFLSVALPLFCIALFVVNPVGYAAWAYTLYWFIPIFAYAIQFFMGRSLFLVSLGSTFVAHAVGSVMWLYLIPSLSDDWIALMPIVALERLLLAAAGFLVYTAVVLLFPRLFSILKRNRICLYY